VLDHVDDICDEFEKALRMGQAPKIEEYLKARQEPERSELLRGLLEVELEYRAERGERSRAEEYELRFPKDLDLIREVFNRDVFSDEPMVPSTLPPGRGAGKPPSRQILLQYVYRRMSREEQRIVNLREQGHHWDQIAEVLNSSPESLREKLARALDRVGAQLGMDRLNM
jgi:hypothetical protein